MFSENYSRIKEKIAEAALSVGKNESNIILLAATKTVDIETINEAIRSGIKYIGENRVQEYLKKRDLYDKAAKKHFIGHLQTNKVKDIIDSVELIHSVDSVHLANEISKQAAKLGVKANVLLEVNIGAEESKSGFSEDEVSEKIAQISALPFLNVKGLMAIPPVCEAETGNVKYFEKMYKLFIDNKAQKMDNGSSMEILSMGMSDDFESAIKCGSNLVRIGTALFGRRTYK